MSRMSREISIRMPTATLLLLLLTMSLLTTTTYIVKASSAKLSVNLNGNDDEWQNLTGWISPAGVNTCPIPQSNHIVWLCCNTTSTPRECQIMWRDVSEGGPTDVCYVRTYINSSGIYGFINLKATPNTIATIRLNTINIDITISQNGVSVVLKDGTISKTGSVAYNINSGNVYNVEFKVEYSFSGEYDMSVSSKKGGNTDTSSFCVDSQCNDNLKVGVSNGVIVNAWVLNSVPVPVPEPSIVVAVVALVVASIGFLADWLKRARRSVLDPHQFVG